MKKVIIIGGGPAGMMAAIAAAENGAKVVLIEKKEKLGKKLRITGKGRCNITSALDNKSFFAGYAGNGRFLFSSFNEFSNHDLIAFLEKHHLKCKVERGNRVFPQTDRADDVVMVLSKELANLGVYIKTSRQVNDILIGDGNVKGIKTDKSTILSDSVIIATGGMSYPATGSTGDGYSLAECAGHTIIEPRPGLVPLVAADKWVRDVAGLSLKNIQAIANDSQGKKINEGFGEMLFTRYGVSGPIILSMSRDIGERIRQTMQPVNLVIDLKPALDEEKLDKRVWRDFNRYANRQLKNSLFDLLPKKLIPTIISLSGIDGSTECNKITRGERRKLVYLCKHLSLSITATRPIEEAIVTAGGVNVKEVNPRTMESKLLKGLFFAGEVLDIDGYTGGFNLQAAFSTGYSAGKHAARCQTVRKS